MRFATICPGVTVGSQEPPPVGRVLLTDPDGAAAKWVLAGGADATAGRVGNVVAAVGKVGIVKLVTEAGTDTQLLALRQYLSGSGAALRWGGTLRFSVALPLPLTPPAV